MLHRLVGCPQQQRRSSSCRRRPCCAAARVRLRHPTTHAYACMLSRLSGEMHPRASVVPHPLKHTPGCPLKASCETHPPRATDLAGLHALQKARKERGEDFDLLFVVLQQQLFSLHGWQGCRAWIEFRAPLPCAQLGYRDHPAAVQRPRRLRPRLTMFLPSAAHPL